MSKLTISVPVIFDKSRVQDLSVALTLEERTYNPTTAYPLPFSEYKEKLEGPELDKLEGLQEVPTLVWIAEFEVDLPVSRGESKSYSRYFYLYVPMTKKTVLDSMTHSCGLDLLPGLQSVDGGVHFSLPHPVSSPSSRIKDVVKETVTQASVDDFDKLVEWCDPRKLQILELLMDGTNPHPEVVSRVLESNVAMNYLSATEGRDCFSSLKRLSGTPEVLSVFFSLFDVGPLDLLTVQGKGGLDCPNVHTDVIADIREDSSAPLNVSAGATRTISHFYDSTTSDVIAPEALHMVEEGVDSTVKFELMDLTFLRSISRLVVPGNLLVKRGIVEFPTQYSDSNGNVVLNLKLTVEPTYFSRAEREV